MSVHVFAHVRQADGVGSLLLLADNMIRVRAEIPRFVSFWMAIGFDVTRTCLCAVALFVLVLGRPFGRSTGPDQKSLGRD